MKVTDEMIAAFGEAWARANRPGVNDERVVGARRRAGLEAVLALIDPVPEDVRVIRDGEGDEWYRKPTDPLVWWMEGDPTLCRTAAYIKANHGGITWEGKS